MLTAFAVLFLAQVKPGPIDAFRANYSSIKVDMEYVFKLGDIDGPTLDGVNLWEASDFGFVEAPADRIIGRWGCDGSTEYFDFSSPEDVIEAGRRADRVVGRRVQYVPKIESLFDGETRAAHIINDELTSDRGLIINVFSDSKLGLISHGKGPFLWWIVYPFPSFLQTEFPGITPRLKSAIRGGHPTEVEIYRKESLPYTEGGWWQVEVFYDPSIGYLPRFARSVVNGGKQGTGIKEFYLAGARPCAAGGFVPTEWYNKAYVLGDFDSRYPSYDYQTELSPGNEKVIFGHFKVTRFKDRSKPVALEHLDGVKAIATPGGKVPLPRGARSLTLADLKSALGRRLTNPTRPPALPSLDRAELNQFSAPEARGWPWYIVAMLVAGLLAGGVAYRRWRRALVLILLFNSAPGCRSDEAPPIIKLTAAFTQPRLLVDQNQPVIPLTLVVRNDGNHRLRLFKADGGCSCRKVDQSGFPVDIEPGKDHSVAVNAVNKRDSSPQSMLFTFQTDHGNLVVPVELLTLARHQFDPESGSHTALDEDDDWSFEVVHRVIYRSGEPRPSAELVAPAEFSAAKVASNSGPVGLAPEYLYEDTRYRLTLRDRGNGLHKVSVSLIDPSRQPLL